MAGLVWHFAANIAKSIIEDVWTIFRGVPAEHTNLGSHIYPVIAAPRSRRCGMGVKNFMAYALLRFAYTVSVVGAMFTMANFKSVYDAGYQVAQKTYSDAETGTADGKCEGKLTDEQDILCFGYTYIQSQFWPVLVAKSVFGIIPSCGIMACRDIVKYFSDSWTVFLMWLLVIVCVAVIVIRIMNGIYNKCTGCMDAERVAGLEYQQQTLLAALPAALRHITNVAVQAQREATTPRIVELHDTISDVRHRTLSE